MNENLNLVELLKDCPKGTKLYSPALGECTLDTLTDDKTFPIRVKYKTKHNTLSELFTENGYLFSNTINAECMLFPSKGQRDWSKWQRPFKDGDILTYMFWCKPTTYIYRENGTHNTSYYAAYSSANNKFYDDGTGALASNRDDLRFATENEKKKLFDVIRENGYQWNPETKTLEKLKKEKFDPKTLQPFDKVLVRNARKCEWVCAFFSHIEEAETYRYFVTTTTWKYCIPYNEDTKHLVGKSEEAPEFYRYWEE